MARKSRLLKEIGDIVDKNSKDINIFEINFEILKSLNNKMMDLKDSRNGSYNLDLGCLGIAFLSKKEKEIDFSFDINNFTFNSYETTCLDCPNRYEVISIKKDEGSFL